MANIKRNAENWALENLWKTIQINPLNILFLTQKLWKIEYIRKFSLFSLRFRLYWDIDYIETWKYANNLTSEVGQEAAEIIALDAYFNLA